MAANKKLTNVIKGRTVKSVSETDDLLTITFDDGSIMKVKKGGQIATDTLNGKTVKSVQQTGTTMTLTFSDDSTSEINLQEPTSSVILRDGKGALEYAD